MPDISMCWNETCPIAATCYRSPASGTKPAEYRQAWISFEPTIAEDGTATCPYFMPVYEGVRDEP